MCLSSLPSERLSSDFLTRAWPIPLHKKLQSRSGAGDQRRNDASMV